MSFWFYITQALAKVALGRWFVWRNVPTSYVRKTAALWFVVRKQRNSLVKETIRQAYNEAKRRR